MRWLAVAVLAASSALVATAATASTGPRRPPQLTILVVAGQSNALGFESFVIDPKTHRDVFTEKGRSLADKQVRFTFDDSGVNGGALPPVPLDTLQKLAKTKIPVFGPELGLARYLYSVGHRNLLIVKVAFSGTSLAVDWAPGSKSVSTLVTRVQDTVYWAETHGWSPKIGGFYWMQGERDATVASYATNYKTNLVHFISSIRRELPLTPTGPFVMGQIDLSQFIQFEQFHRLCTTKLCTAEKRWNHEVMSAQAAVTGKYVFLAKTTKLPRYHDFLHLTDVAELALGKKWGQLTRYRI